MILSFAATKRTNGRHTRVVCRYDVSVAFFHAMLKAKILVIPPKGLIAAGWGWALDKAMYGTREAAQADPPTSTIPRPIPSGEPDSPAGRVGRGNEEPRESSSRVVQPNSVREGSGENPASPEYRASPPNSTDDEEPQPPRGSPAWIIQTDSESDDAPRARRYSSAGPRSKRIKLVRRVSPSIPTTDLVS